MTPDSDSFATTENTLGMGDLALGNQAEVEKAAAWWSLVCSLCDTSQ